MRKILNIFIVFLYSLPVYAHHSDLLLNKISHEQSHVVFNMLYVSVCVVVFVLLVKSVIKK